MQRVLYIGQHTLGSTSRMRADVINKIFEENEFDFIDTNVPFYKTTRAFRTLGFRYKIGPLIWAINNYIKRNLNSFNYDLIWIDKGVFVNLDTIKLLKGKTKKLVHYTPDMAFYANKSKHFELSLPLYDYVITTKSVEIDEYLTKISKEKLILTTQGFSEKTHRPYYEFDSKDNAVVFIGLGESSRFEIVSLLINKGINVKLVGKGWRQFVYSNRENEYLNFISEGVFGEDYSKLISSSKFALGLLSKNFHELHTTRTFEIPACGTALITENNDEIKNFYDNNEVIFYNSYEEIVKRIKYYIENETELKELTERGYFKVKRKGYDYDTILTNIIKAINIR